MDLLLRESHSCCMQDPLQRSIKGPDTFSAPPKAERDGKGDRDRLGFGNAFFRKPLLAQRNRKPSHLITRDALSISYSGRAGRNAGPGFVASCASLRLNQ